MISTVTTTATAIVSTGLGAALSGVAVLALVAFLVQRELATAGGQRLRPLARNLTVAITPLVVTFAVIAASRLAALL